MNDETTLPTTGFRYPDYAAMVKELLETSRQRRNIEPGEHFTDGAYLETFAVGFRGYRQTGKTRFALTQLVEGNTILITANLDYRDGLLSTLDDQGLHDSIITARSVDTMLKASKRYTDFVLATDHPLHTVKTIVVDEACYISDVVSLRQICRWARLGGQTPEIIVIN